MHTIAALLDSAQDAGDGPVVQVLGACALAALMAAAREELGRAPSRVASVPAVNPVREARLEER